MIDVSEEDVHKFMQKLTETDPVFAYIIGNMGVALKNLVGRITDIENRKKDENN